MYTVKRSVTQTVADSTASVLIDTNLTVDGKSGWNILGMRVIFESAFTIPATASSQLNAVLSSDSNGVCPTFTDNEEICTVSHYTHGTAASTSAYCFDPVRSVLLPIARTTVQPQLELFCSSWLTTQVNRVAVEIYYDIIKLTDLEVMRLLQGGA